MNRTAIALLTLGLAAALPTAFAESRSFTVNVTATAGQPVPVSLTLLQVRDTLGADFGTNYASVRVTSGTTEVPYQIDDMDGNGRPSGSDELSFLASGPVTVTASDDASATAPAYAPAFAAAAPTAEGVTRLSGPNGLVVEVNKQGLTRIAGFDGVQGLLADELGNARIEGYNASTFYKDQQYGAYLEGKMTMNGMTLVSSRILPAGPARFAVVSKYTSPDFAGLDQTVITRAYTTGAVDVQSTFNFRGYADMMKFENQATRLVTDQDPNAVHLMPVPRRSAYADLAGQSPLQFYMDAKRKAVITVDGQPYLDFPAAANLQNPFWGGEYLFTSPEAWRANFSPKLHVGVAEVAYGQPALASDYTSFVAGNQWQFESGEMRTGTFRWLPDEMKPIQSAAGLFQQPNPFVAHYFPGDTVNFHYQYVAFRAGSGVDAVRFLSKYSQDVASVAVAK
ncbi:MAG TPA: hypothetical protein VHN99_12415 [Deinococcales bacterium]|nr:hypothetical protein [Deinococcales bacterium]